MPGKHVLEEIRTSDIRIDPRNARTHSRKQIHQIAESIRAFGFTNPLLIDETNKVIAGHGRLAAAVQLELSKVPAIRLQHLTDVQKRALALADNKLALNAGWDEQLLAVELRYLCEVEVDFDVTVTGFETPEIDLLIEGQEPEIESEADHVPEPPARGEVCVHRGDLWLLGRHRLLCGDATRGEGFERLMAGTKAQAAIVDPPYNVPIHGHVCGSGRIKHREFIQASGEMSEREFTAFLTQALSNLAAHSASGSLHYLFASWHHLYELLTAGRAVYAGQKALCVWNKSNAGMGSLYRSKHELVAVFKNGTAPHINNIQLGKHGRYRSNVWDYAGANSFGADRLNDLAAHPTVKPVALIADAILDCSRRGGIVLDSFVGSGTTIIAAERTGRVAHAMELDPGYVETAIRRWQDYTGDVAVHAESGLTFEQVRGTRARAPQQDESRRTAEAPNGVPSRLEADHVQ